MDGPQFSPVKVHRQMCSELESFIDGILSIISAIEAARPPRIHALCLLHKATDEAKILIRQCSESSKLYLAYSADKILSRCLKIQKTMDLCLSQLQNLVPPLLSAQVSVILGDIKGAMFTIELAEHDAGRALSALLRQEATITSDCKENLELHALRSVCGRLQISSPLTLQMEKASIKVLLTQLQSKDSRNKQILSYILNLLRKHGESVLEEQDNLSISY